MNSDDPVLYKLFTLFYDNICCSFKRLIQKVMTMYTISIPFVYDIIMCVSVFLRYLITFDTFKPLKPLYKKTCILKFLRQGLYLLIYMFLKYIDKLFFCHVYICLNVNIYAFFRLRIKNRFYL